jgi:hypothetical protein
MNDPAFAGSVSEYSASCAFVAKSGLVSGGIRSYLLQ